MDLVAAGRGHEVRAGSAQHSLPLERALLLADQARHPHDHEAEQADRCQADDCEVVVAVAQVVDDADHRRDERCAREQREPEPREHPLGLHRRLVDLRHRRMQGSRPPKQVEPDPAGVQPDLMVVGALHQHEPVQEVGCQQADDARDHQVEGQAALPSVQGKPHGDRQEQHVGHRVGHGYEPAHRRERVIVHVRRDQPNPGRERESDRQDRRVDRAATVTAARPAPLQDHEPGDQGRVDRQIRGVAERWERHVAVKQERVAVRVEVTEPEQEEAKGDERPGEPRCGR